MMFLRESFEWCQLLSVSGFLSNKCLSTAELKPKSKTSCILASPSEISFSESSLWYEQSSTQFYNNMFTILAVHCLNHSATSSMFTILKCVCPPCPAATSYSWQNFLLSPPGAHLSYWTNTRQSLCPEGWYHRQAKCSKTPKVLVFHGVSAFHRLLQTQS